LAKRHSLRVSVETLRQWMMAAGLWRAKTRYERRAFPRRERRARIGELVQIDGSNHDWFDWPRRAVHTHRVHRRCERELLYLRFVPAETTWAYLDGLRHCPGVYGRPLSLYSDRHSIFRINDVKASAGSEARTQFGRVLDSLGIEAIHPNTPQAKGRVERANATLQDRLVKELRLAAINDFDAANAFLEGYRESFNARFAVQPRSAEIAHRPVLHEETKLELIFSLQYERIVSKNLEIHYDSRIYQIQAPRRARKLRQSKVTVCERQDGSLMFLSQGQPLQALLLPTQPARAPKRSPDRRTLKPTHPVKPAANHPWRRYAVNPRQAAPR
jgi:hypothetical protein